MNRKDRGNRGCESRKIFVGFEGFHFHEHEVSKETLTGRDLLEVSGHEPVGEHLLLQLLHEGGVESIRPNEIVKLRGGERFIAFRSDRSWRFEINARRFEWGLEQIRALDLKMLAQVDPSENGVWLVLRDTPDRLLADDELVSLSGEQVERFRTDLVFFLCLEGKTVPWPEATISMEQIAEAGGWDPALGVIEVDEDQNERQLKPGEIVTLKPGLSYGKKVGWKRGATAVHRIDEELELLRCHYHHVEHRRATNLHWFRVKQVRTPAGCSPNEVDIVFFVTEGYPGAAPYGFFVPDNLRIGASCPQSTGAKHQPPFDGRWIFLSHSPTDWNATNDIQSGSNLWSWVRSFSHRLSEGP